MSELKKLIEGFYNQNSNVILQSILLATIYSVLTTIVLPNFISNLVDNINQKKSLKNEFIKIFPVFIFIEVANILATHFRTQLEPEIIKYVTNELLKMVFNKYEQENVSINTSVLINKIYLIKKCFQEFSTIVFTNFVPKIIALILSCINLIYINKKIGALIFVCIFIQIGTSLYDLKDCMLKSYNENEVKDEIYDYIEDLFFNIDTIQLTPNGFENELKTISDMCQNIKKVESETLQCITNKQYTSNIIKFVFCVIILYTIYKLNSSQELIGKDTTTILLLIFGLLNSITTISGSIPEATSRIGILMNNEDFLKSINSTKTDENKITEMILTCNNIEFKNVSFSYDEKKILDNLSLLIDNNSFICLYGPSGSGKSTFIKLIYGIETPTCGEILLEGYDISKYKLNEFRKNISYINQNTSKLFHKSVYNNIIYGYDDTNELKEKVKKLFTDFEFYDVFKNLDTNKEKWSFLNESVGKLGENLSGGQKQIIHLLRLELNNRAKVVILDEPSSALDDKSRESVSKYIKYLNSKGKTILLITHDEYYKKICNKILNFSNDTNPILNNN
jgi:ATP-binding cassette subfamily B protein